MWGVKCKVWDGKCKVWSVECKVWSGEVWGVKCKVLEHQNEHFVRDFLKFHTSQRQNQRFPTSFLMDLLQNRRFVRGFRRFS